MRCSNGLCFAAVVAVLAAGCVIQQGPPPALPPAAPAVRSAPPAGPPPATSAPSTVARGDVVALAATRLPRYVIIVGDRAYWSNGAGEVASVSLDGGPVTVHHRPGGGGRALARVLASDGHYLYFTSIRGIHRMPLDAREPPQLLVQVPDALSLTVGDDQIYFTRFDHAGIFRVGKYGGVPIRVARSKLPSSLVVAGRYLYWTSYGDGTVNRIGVGSEHGSDRVEVLARSRRPTALAVLGDDIVWASEVGGAIHAQRIGDLDSHRVLVRGARNHDIFASDGRYVYWGSWQPPGKGRLSRLSLPDGDEEILADDLRSPVGVAVSGETVIVANKGEDTILKVSTSSRVP